MCKLLCKINKQSERNMSLDFQGIEHPKMFLLFKFLTILFSSHAGTFGESIYGGKFPGENT